MDKEIRFKYFVYILKDPDTLEPKYIGCSKNPFSRFNQHMSDKKPRRTGDPKAVRLCSLDNDPIVEILAGFKNENQALYFEAHFIKCGFISGLDLVNKQHRGGI